MLKQKKLKTILILIIKISLNIKNNYICTKKIEFSLIKDLKRPSKPPILTNLCQICRKNGSEMPEHFKKVIDWSIQISENNTRWDGHLICAEALNVDNIPISPSHGTSLFDVLVVHKELFLGFD